MKKAKPRDNNKMAEEANDRIKAVTQHFLDKSFKKL